MAIDSNILNSQRLPMLRKILLLTALMLALILFGLDRYAANTHRPQPGSKQVVIYTTSWCGYCKALRKALAANKIPFTEYDVEQSFQGQLGFWTLRARGIPVSVVGPQVIYGYQIDKVQSALEKLNYPFDPILAYRQPQDVN
jgi:glutaredoxin